MGENEEIFVKSEDLSFFIYFLFFIFQKKTEELGECTIH